MPVLRSLVSVLAEVPTGSVEAASVERLTLLEEIKAACTAAQVRETAKLDELRAADEAGRNIPKGRRGRGLAAEVGLARKVSPQKGSQYLGFSRALAHEMPHTMSALTDGVLTEWRATILVRETAYLTRESREEIDRRICSDRQVLLGASDREIEALAKRHAYELEPAAVVQRKSKAEKDRRVGIRPAPDLMTQLSATLPLAQGISVYASLKKYADSVLGSDDRTHAQIMADTLTERVTGRSAAEPTPVAVNVVLSERALLDIDQSAADVMGYGPIPAAVARELVASSVTSAGETGSTLRRLYARPADGALVAMESRSRTFPPSLAHFIRLRDQRCRTPYCGAPIAEIDHARPHRHDGPTSEANADGACVAHNRAKEAGGWKYEVRIVGDNRVIEVITPTGARHRSAAPPAIGHREPTNSVIETRLLQLLAAA
ncbi:DUF222 domain-containing protein [Gordonia jinghuaiqii]|uniref:DUF222 domain-containing protein n=1 Tax=Gordonia jinghuaiqii TaxID=2758710 RepID=A0A7D7QKB3_9ACTN|nr:DUF222 domain-containing protein [Gordonia jinghuaiqii]QMT03864.1 DUF222 domain-containing protein [Gordonia jinghuaiqii]